MTDTQDNHVPTVSREAREAVLVGCLPQAATPYECSHCGLPFHQIKKSKSRSKYREKDKGGQGVMKKCSKDVSKSLTAYYCSKKCQQRNWPVHKKYCGKTVEGALIETGSGLPYERDGDGNRVQLPTTTPTVTQMGLMGIAHDTTSTAYCSADHISPHSEQHSRNEFRRHRARLTNPARRNTIAVSYPNPTNNFAQTQPPALASIAPPYMQPLQDACYPASGLQYQPIAILSQTKAAGDEEDGEGRGGGDEGDRQHVPHIDLTAEGTSEDPIMLDDSS